MSSSNRKMEADRIGDLRSGGVLDGRELFGENPTNPRYSDRIWNLVSSTESPTISEMATLKLDFSKIPTAFEDEVRKYCAARLLGPEPLSLMKRFRRPSGLTVAKEFGDLKRFSRWLISIGVARPSETRQQHLDAFIAHLDARKLKLVTQSKYQSTIGKLYAYRDHAGLVWIKTPPWPEESLVKVPRRGENITSRIPEAVLGSLVQWALFYVEVAVADIEEAIKEIELQSQRPPRPAAFNEGPERVQAFVADLRRRGKGIPALPARNYRSSLVGENHLRPNYNAVAKECQVASVYSGESRRIFDAAVDELGLEPGDIDTEISLHPNTGRPWRPRFSSGELMFEISHLQTACFVVCAMSGMREEEIRRLKVGCVREEPIIEGGPIRYKVTGGLTKGRDGEEEATWVVIPEIAKAISVAESFSTGEFLFGPWKLQKQGDRKLDPHQSNQRINRFANEAIASLAKFNKMPTPPLIDGVRWHFTGRQFRRTIAFYIARQPFGVVAGKIQFKHLSVGAFEGYAGTSPANFRAEIEEERQLAGADRFAEIYDGFLQGEPIGGPGGDKMAKLCEELSSTLGEFPGRVVDEKRRRAILRHVDRHLYIGAVSDCLYEKPDALCRSADTAHKGPIINECRPAECKNSCVTRANLPEWKSARDEAIAAKRVTGKSEMQKRVIDEAIAICNREIDLLERDDG